MKRRTFVRSTLAASNCEQNLERLTAGGNRFDPANLFRLNMNICPTVS